MRPRYWRRVCRRAGWTRRLCGRILPPSTARRGAESWIASLRGSRASRSASPAPVRPRPTSDGSGRTSSAFFAMWDPATCSWRTPQGYLFGGWAVFSGTWPGLGMMRSGVCSVRPGSEPPIFAGGCSSWRSPTSWDWNGPSAQSWRDRATGDPAPTLPDQLVNWQTPTATDAKGRTYTYPRGDRTKRSLTLAGQARCPSLSRLVRKTPHGSESSKGGPGSPLLWGTPTSHVRSHSPRKVAHGKQLANQAQARLSPLFVEWLMGFPIGWTGSAPLEMASCRLWRRWHSALYMSGCRADEGTGAA
jgi:hypothetical protein